MAVAALCEWRKTPRKPSRAPSVRRRLRRFLEADLAGRCFGAGALVAGVEWRIEQDGTTDEAQGEQLEGSHSHPGDHLTLHAVACQEDAISQLDCALLLDGAERQAAFGRVCLVHQHQRLALVHGASHLAHAIATAEIAAAEEDKHAGRSRDVALKRSYFLSLIHI